eukprot:TRINITY_DN37505_c1_g1_i2.p1 TRINITY_DN37505_c1_g1~~TRINITY_DN37505_c1_g1_i2.p1  ORF type:complete len:473 (+),score=122.12 TRINITY_DN37505_c1_g1_i2:82-1419(+)
MRPVRDPAAAGRAAAELHAATCALLVVDCQEGYRGACGPVLQRVLLLVRAFRAAGATVVCVAQEQSTAGASLQLLRHFAPQGGRGFQLCSELAAELPPRAEVRGTRGALQLLPHPEDPPPRAEPQGSGQCYVITKRTFDGFHGTGLDAELRGRGVGAVAVCGVLSDKCVLATARSASRLGYRVVWARDASAAGAESEQARLRHDSALETAAAWAEVLPARLIAARLRPGPAAAPRQAPSGGGSSSSSSSRGARSGGSDAALGSQTRSPSAARQHSRLRGQAALRRRRLRQRLSCAHSSAAAAHADPGDGGVLWREGASPSESSASTESGTLRPTAGRGRRRRGRLGMEQAPAPPHWLDSPAASAGDAAAEAAPAGPPGLRSPQPWSAGEVFAATAAQYGSVAPAVGAAFAPSLAAAAAAAESPPELSGGEFRRGAPVPRLAAASS